MNELRPCPFCGSNANDPELSTNYFGVLMCSDCGVHASIDTWNTRPIEDKLQSELEEQTKLADGYKKLMLLADKQKMEFVHELDALRQNLKEAVEEIEGERVRLNDLRNKVNSVGDFVASNERYCGLITTIDILRAHHLIEEE